MVVYRGWIATLKFILYQSGWGESSLVAIGDTRTGQAENITTNMISFQSLVNILLVSIVILLSVNPIPIFCIGYQIPSRTAHLRANFHTDSCKTYPLPSLKQSTLSYFKGYSHCSCNMTQSPRPVLQNSKGTLKNCTQGGTFCAATFMQLLLRDMPGCHLLSTNFLLKYAKVLLLELSPLHLYQKEGKGKGPYTPPWELPPDHLFPRIYVPNYSSHDITTFGQ